jgi:hypothetical protein
VNFCFDEHFFFLDSRHRQTTESKLTCPAIVGQMTLLKQPRQKEILLGSVASAKSWYPALQLKAVRLPSPQSMHVDELVCIPLQALSGYG